MSENNNEQPKSRVGPPVWIESLMTAEEYKECAKKYKTYCPSCNKVANFNLHSRWRYGMGSTPSLEEMEKRNREIESLREFVLSQQQQKL